MAITVNKRTVTRIGKFQMEILECSFSTTDTTGTVGTSLNIVEAHSIGLNATTTLAAAEAVSLSEVGHTSDGKISVTAGVLTVARVGASVTSGLHFSLILWGY